MLGLHGFDDRQEVLGEPAVRLVAPVDRERAQADIVSLFERGVATGEYEILRRDGSTRPVETSVAMIRNAAGNADQIVAITRDITERKTAERELRESKELHETFMSNAPAIVVVRDLDGRVVDANEALLDALGKTKEAVLGTTILDVFPRGDATNRALAHNRRVVYEDRPSTSQLKFSHTDGSIHHYTVTRFPLRNADSVTVGVGVIAIRAAKDELEQRVADRTAELKQLNEALLCEVLERKNAEFETRVFKEISDNANYSLAILNLDGTIRYTNRHAAEAHGYSVDELVGKHVSVFHNEEQMDAVQQIIRHVQRGGEFGAAEIWHQHRDGTRFPMLMSGLLLRDEKGVPSSIAATGIDLPEHKRIE